MSPLPLWLGWLALVALMLTITSATIVAHELDIPMAASYLLVLHGGFSKVWHIVSSLIHLPFALLERNGISPWVFFGALAICVLRYPNQAFVEVTKIIAEATVDISQARSNSKRDKTIAQLRQELAKYVKQLAKCVNPDEVAALERVHESRVEKLKKELERRKTELDEKDRRLTTKEDDEAAWRLKTQELESQLKTISNSDVAHDFRVENFKLNQSLCKAKNTNVNLGIEVKNLKQKSLEDRQRYDSYRQMTDESNDLKRQNLTDAHDHALQELVEGHERTIREKDQQIREQADEIRRSELETEKTVHDQQQRIEEQAQLIGALEGQVSERDSMPHMVDSQLVLIKTIISNMIDGQDGTEKDIAILFLASLKHHGMNLADLGVDIQRFNELFAWLCERQARHNAALGLSPRLYLQEQQAASSHEDSFRDSGFDAGPPTMDQAMDDYPADQPASQLEDNQRGASPVPPQGPANAVVPFTQMMTNVAAGKSPRGDNPVPPQGAANSVLPSTTSAPSGNIQRSSNVVPPPANSAGVQGFSMLNMTPGTGGNVQRSSNAVPPPANSAGVQGFSMHPAPDLSGLLNMPPGMGPSSGGAASSSKSARSSRYTHGDKSLDYGASVTSRALR
jgi:uncharacterized protein YijF (DUF1287 family)